MVDASQGVEAQTLANVYQALDQDHEIIPILNKVESPPPPSLPGSARQIEEVIGLDASGCRRDLGQDRAEYRGGVLEAIVTRLPPPKGDRKGAAEGDAGRPLLPH